MNLPQLLQQHLQYPALQTIDATTGLPENEATFDSLSQSSLITFLAGLYKATRTKETANLINRQLNGRDLLNDIFPTIEEVVNTVAAFCNQPKNVVKEKLLEVSNGYLTYVQQQIPGDAEIQKEDYLHNYMSAQRSEILTYIPSGLKLGDLLNDKSLEDNTNKMQGPVSSLMHKIENVFSKSD